MARPYDTSKLVERNRASANCDGCLNDFFTEKFKHRKNCLYLEAERITQFKKESHANLYQT